MTTRQNPMAGRYFNDPNFAAAVSNLAGAFAPPSPEEYLIAEKVKGERFQNENLADLYANVDGFDPMALDRRAALLGAYTPNQGFNAVNMADATTRRGQDVAADTSRYNTVATGLIDRASTPLTDRQALAPISDELADFIGGPALPAVSGADLGAAPTPLSETEMMALIIGQQSPEKQRALLDPSTVNTVGANGQPIVTAEIDAIGQPAFVNPGSESAPKAITFERGGVRLGGFIKGDQYVDAAGNPLSVEEAGTAAEVGKPVGTNSELGITNSIVTERSRINSITTESDMLVDDLTSMIQGQAGAVGLAGTLQNVGQNILQVGQELGSAFAGDENALITPEMLSGVVQDGQNYDPTFAQLRAGMLQLAYLNAQRDNPSGEVSRFALERQIEALGQGLLSNDQSVLAALDMTKKANARKRTAYGTEGAATAPGAPTAGVADGLTEEDLQYLGAP